VRRDIAIEETLPFPVEDVWAALTDPAALAEWVMPVEDFAPVVGQRFRFTARPMPGWDGVINCEVLEVDPPHRLVLRWQGSQMRNPTTVTWTLAATDAGTRLRIDHQGFDGALLRLMHKSGWRRLAGKRLPGLLATAS
jgi:uncharacterized protein YndB with AHSA1/START domain